MALKRQEDKMYKQQKEIGNFGKPRKSNVNDKDRVSIKQEI